MKDRDALNCSRICNSPLYSFIIREDGVVLRTRHSNLKESRAKVSMIRGRAFVYIGKKAYKLDSLVASHFIKGYKPNDIIEHIDGKPKNCAVWNLRIIPRSEYAKQSCRNNLCKQVSVNGVVYPSVQSCAKAIYVEPSTLHNYLKGKYKSTMLDGMDIRLIQQEETGGRT